MPARLWDAACLLARDLGVHRIKSALGLNYESLKKRIGKVEEEEVVKAPAFVELRDAHVLGAVRSTVVEIADAGGCRMTVQLGPGNELDVVGLVEAFRRRG
jgi:hypothetical protein